MGEGYDIHSHTMMATTAPMNKAYPDKKSSNFVADRRISHGTTAHARICTMYCPRRMLMNRGNSMEESAPKEIMLAAMLVPRICTSQAKATRNTANRVVPDQ